MVAFETKSSFKLHTERHDPVLSAPRSILTTRAGCPWPVVATCSSGGRGGERVNDKQRHNDYDQTKTSTASMIMRILYTRNKVISISPACGKALCWVLLHVNDGRLVYLCFHLHKLNVFGRSLLQSIYDVSRKCEVHYMY